MQPEDRPRKKRVFFARLWRSACKNLSIVFVCYLCVCACFRAFCTQSTCAHSFIHSFIHLSIHLFIGLLLLLLSIRTAIVRHRWRNGNGKERERKEKKRKEERKKEKEKRKGKERKKEKEKERKKGKRKRKRKGKKGKCMWICFMRWFLCQPEDRPRKKRKKFLRTCPLKG